MRTQIYRMVVHFKASPIYLSEHDPFLFGNIARRGVIGTISRKAISPLTKSMIKVCESETDIN
ncbi:MAG: hypothetical protein K2L23_07375 [Odoribacter sp.]|nr:hypothetical protein [Odoribacter sp.]